MICPHCKKETALHKYDPEEYRRRKSENARRSMAKAKANGTVIGRPRKIDYKRIREARKFGMSFSAIAAKFKISVGAVQHALKELADDQA